jgi:hypothetical protein
VGNGATILISTEPDAPVNLVRNLAEPYDQNQIALSWQDGAFNGNQPVLDYKIMLQNP